MEGCPIMKRWHNHDHSPLQSRAGLTFEFIQNTLRVLSNYEIPFQELILHPTIQMMAWLEQERLEGERELGEGDTYVVYQVETPASPGRHLPSWWSIWW